MSTPNDPVTHSETPNTSPPNQQTDKSFAELALRLVEQSRKEITYVRWAYAFVAPILAILIAVGIYFTYSSSRDLKTELREQRQEFRDRSKEEFDLQQRKLDEHLQEAVVKTSEQVSKRIDQAFETKDIKQLVETKARERIDLIADSLINSQVVSRIDPLKTELTTLIRSTSDTLNDHMGKLDAKQAAYETTESETEKVLSQAKQTLSDVQSRSDFLLTFIAAQNDDLSAFEKLVNWSRDPFYPMRNLAESAYTAIRSSAARSIDKPSPVYDWPAFSRTNEISLADLQLEWKSVPASKGAGFVRELWEHRGTPDETKLAFLHDVLHDSHNSILTLNLAGTLIGQKAHIEYEARPFFLEPLEQWYINRSVTNLPAKSTPAQTK